jgi:hypothetical protein
LLSILSGTRHGPSVTLNRRYQPREDRDHQVRRHGVQQDRHSIARTGLGRSRLLFVAYPTPQFFWVDTFPRYVVDEIEQESINDR